MFVCVAPMALRMPISRMRSVMLASMMFMMPMPPTSRLIPAMIPPLSRALRIAVVICSDQFSCVWNAKSSMPLCTLMSTLRACCKEGSNWSMSATLMLSCERRGSGMLLLPVAERNFIHMVLSGMYTVEFFIQ